MQPYRFWTLSNVVVLCAGLLAAAVIAGAFSCLSYVEPGESVVKDCDGDLTVWRGPEDAGIKWDGLCRTATYNDAVQGSLREEIKTDGTRVTLRGRYLALFPQDAERVLQIYRAHGRQDDLMRDVIDRAVVEEVRAAAVDSAWHQSHGGVIKRGLKDALEYGLRRVSPTGDIWSAPEAKHALEDAIQRRLDTHVFPPGVTVQIQLGFVTER